MVKKVKDKGLSKDGSTEGVGIVRTAAYSKKASKQVTLRHQLTREEYKQHKANILNRQTEYRATKRKLAVLNIEQIYQILDSTVVGNEKTLYSRLIDIGWMHDLTLYQCPKCGSGILMQGYGRSIDKYTWRCRAKKCRYRMGLRTYSNEVFKTHRQLPISVIVNYIFSDWLHIHNRFETQIVKGFSSETITNLRRTMRTQIKWNREVEDYKFGGNGIVEIDELVLKRWKNPDTVLQFALKDTAFLKSPSRILKYLWIFGITERGTETRDKLRVHFDIMNAKPSYDNPKDTGRNRSEVDRILFPKLLEGAVVMSDQHSMYLKMKERMQARGLNIEHNTINKRQEKYIVTKKGDPNLKIYTQGIENKWRLFRKIYRKFSRVTEDDLQDVLLEIAWRIENIDNLYEETVKLIEAVQIDLIKINGK